MRLPLFAALLALTGCATPPDRYDAFADAMGRYAATLGAEAEASPPALPPLPAPKPAGRGRQPESAAYVPPPDCARPASLASVDRQRCTAAERVALLAVAQAHARALADYIATLRGLATRLTGPPEQEAIRFTREEVFGAGERLMGLLTLTAQDLPPIRGVDARVGLRPAFGAEMAEHGWRIRQQMELQAEALTRLAALRGPELAASLPRLRAALTHLQSAFEALVVSDRDALPEIEQARQALTPRSF